ncbi:MAG: choloylglycine hydrolase family protein [Ruminococcaceae bacterium]|nr:choloylglycine hydrolase family protein [Oscillospiraceae bacterium]
MCTAITKRFSDRYFGRTLDYDRVYPFRPLMTPRYFHHDFRHTAAPDVSFAILGMGMPVDGVPLFFDAVNEKGVYAAGLLFDGNAVYRKPLSGMDNIPSFALIPWLLGHCADLQEVRTALTRINITDTPFREDLPPSPLHWFIGDGETSLVVESLADGIQIHDNPAEILTNNPPFLMQMHYLSRFMSLSPYPAENRLAPEIPLVPDSRGMGTLGLPGDGTSVSRFVRGAFVLHNAEAGGTEEENVGQIFHMMGTVEQVKGCVRLADGGVSFTQYTSCVNASRGIYYYTTYGSRRITAVDMYAADLDGREPICFPLTVGEDILYTPGRVMDGEGVKT